MDMPRRGRLDMDPLQAECQRMEPQEPRQMDCRLMCSHHRWRPPAAPSVTMPAGLMTPPALPESLFVGFCLINPGEQRPAMSLHPGLTTPGQRQGAIMSKDATSGEVRTLSPTPYKGAQVNALISLWAPGGLAMLRDGQQQCRRVYQ